MVGEKKWKAEKRKGTKDGGLQVLVQKTYHNQYIYPLTSRGRVSGTQNIDIVVFLFPRGEIKRGYMYLSPSTPKIGHKCPSWCVVV